MLLEMQLLKSYAYSLSCKSGRDVNVYIQRKYNISQSEATMVKYNALTGLRRCKPLVNLSRKNRGTHSSTVAARMYTGFVMEAFVLYMTGAEVGMRSLASMMASHCQVPDQIINCVMFAVLNFVQQATVML